MIIIKLLKGLFFSLKENYCTNFSDDQIIIQIKKQS